MSDNLKQEMLLSEMINTRFCHDMAGSISATFNGIEYYNELAEQDDEMRKQAMDLLVMSSKESLAKLQTYRLAYGKAEKGTTCDLQEVEEILRRFFEYRENINFEWLDKNLSDSGGKISTEIRRLIVNIINVVSYFLAFGGDITFIGEDNLLTIKARAERFRKDDEMIGLISGTVPPENNELTPYNIPIYFLLNVVQAINSRVEFDISNTTLELRVKT